MIGNRKLKNNKSCLKQNFSNSNIGSILWCWYLCGISHLMPSHLHPNQPPTTTTTKTAKRGLSTLTCSRSHHLQMKKLGFEPMWSEPTDHMVLTVITCYTNLKAMLKVIYLTITHLFMNSLNFINLYAANNPKNTDTI